jgi:hypothetical protein
LKLKFHKYVVLRIKSETQVEEVRSFVHMHDPSFHSLFFSDDCQYMLETLENDRIFLYQWNERKWEVKRRMV